MTIDFGYQPARRMAGLTAPRMVGVVFAILVAGGLGFAIWSQDHNRAMAKSQAWVVDGPPCPAPSAAAIAASPEQADQAVVYNGVTFLRASGAIACDLVKEDGGRSWRTMSVCKFSSPGVVRVKTGHSDVVYGPRLFQPVIVTLPGGDPRCAVVPHDRIKDLMHEFY